MTEQLAAELATLESILLSHASDPPQSSEGLRLTYGIYIMALTDAAKALRAIVEFQKEKTPPGDGV